MAGREVADRFDPTLLPSSLAGAQDAETLGQALRRARQQRGLTIPQIAATTRIPARILEALERDDIGAVPGGMYLRADVRAYADAVGLSRSVALAYLPAVEPPVPLSAPAHATVASALRRPSTFSVVIGSICLVLAAMVMWPRDRELRPASSGRLAAAVPAAPRQAAAAIADRAPAAAPAADSLLHVSADSAVSATSGVKEPESNLASDSALAVSDQPPARTVAADPELEVVTEPAGARVTMDGIGWGVTPVTIRYLPPGGKQLRVTRDGYATETRLIRISPDQQRTTVRIELHQVQ